MPIPALDRVYHQFALAAYQKSKASSISESVPAQPNQKPKARPFAEMLATSAARIAKNHARRVDLQSSLEGLTTTRKRV
jgi:DNA-binding transcriptional regulator/RsmH inhibitor MraZ